MIYRGAASGSVCRGGQAQMGEAELVLVWTGGGHRDLDAADADPHQRANLEQLEADRSAGRLCKLGMPQESS